MLSNNLVNLIKILPESIVIKIARKIVQRYLKRYADIKVSGFDKIENVQGAKIFICNHLSNSDGFILESILKKKYDPTFVAGVKLTNDPITNFGTKIVKHISIKPNTADKEAIVSMINLVKSGESLVIFPEGTRSRTSKMIKGKKGVLLVAKMSKASVVPISMWGTEKLLPINENGDMGSEKWNEAEVNVKFGDPVLLPKKKKEESKHEYDERCLTFLMKEIAKGLPEQYRGFYK